MKTGKPRRRDRRRVLVAALMLTAAVVASVQLTAALYTDTEAVGSNVFTVGTLDLSTSPTSALFNAPAMAPGDEVAASLNVSNDGSLDLRYAVESSTTEDVLAAQLTLTIRSGVTTCDTTNWDADGTQIYSGILGSTSVETIIGDKTQGADTGDRTLSAGNNEDLCFHVELPLTAPDASQGVTTTATFTFYAEQTVNNP